MRSRLCNQIKSPYNVIVTSKLQNLGKNSHHIERIQLSTTVQSDDVVMTTHCINEEKQCRCSIVTRTSQPLSCLHLLCHAHFFLSRLLLTQRTSHLSLHPQGPCRESSQGHSQNCPLSFQYDCEPAVQVSQHVACDQQEAEGCQVKPQDEQR